MSIGGRCSKLICSVIALPGHRESPDINCSQKMIENVGPVASITTRVNHYTRQSLHTGEGDEPDAVLNWDTLVEPALIPNNRVVGISRISVHTPVTWRHAVGRPARDHFVAQTYRQR